MKTEAPKKKRFSGQLFLKSLYQKKKKKEEERKRRMRMTSFLQVICCKISNPQFARKKQQIVFYCFNSNISFNIILNYLC